MLHNHVICWTSTVRMPGFPFIIYQIVISLEQIGPRVDWQSMNSETSAVPNHNRLGAI